MDVILIHGMWCTGDHWQRVRAVLEKSQFRVHTPTLPQHHPQNDADVGKVSISEYGEFLNAYIDQLNLSEPPVIIGHSMGGLLAQQLAAQRKVSALVLLTPASPWGINALNYHSTMAFLPTLTRWGFWRKSHRLSEHRFRNYATNCLNSEAQDYWLAQSVAESGRAAFEIGFWILDGRRASQVAESTPVPTYIVGCAHDRLVPLSVVRKVAKRYPHATFREYADRDHWVIGDDHTETMIGDIIEWLKENGVEANA